MDDKDESQTGDELPLADDLGINSWQDFIIGKHGKLFSAAGRHAAIAEIGRDFLLMHSPDLPLNAVQETEEITLRTDEHGILLDELGERIRIGGAKFNGDPIYVLGEYEPGTNRNLVAALDKNNRLHRLYWLDNPLTAMIAYKLRNRTHDGELTAISDLRAESD